MNNFKDGSKYGAFDLTSKNFCSILHPFSWAWIERIPSKVYNIVHYVYIVCNPMSEHQLLFGSNLAWNTNYHQPLESTWQKLLHAKCYFLLVNPNKIVFHKNLNLFFLKYHDIHASNMLFLHDTPVPIDNLQWNSISTFLFSTIPIYQQSIFLYFKSPL